MRRAKKIKHYTIPIFTEEYAVDVAVGLPEELDSLGSKHQYRPLGDFTSNDKRGMTYNLYPEKHPLILVRADLPHHIRIATLGHEASHAVDYLMDHIGIEPREGEFRAHAIATILRTVLSRGKL